MLVAKSSSKIPTSPPECLLEATEWTYLAEGGANVIFRYTGTHQPWLNMHVLRIQKVTSCPGKNCKSILNFVTDKVMPLLNDKYLQCGHVLEISNASFLVELNQQLCQVEHRPIHRKATLLDESATHLMLLPDLNRSQVCIELKPKSSLQPRLEGIKQEVCRYCMHQHLKLKQNAIQGISQYCPMDLFSKDLERMTKALRALEQTPQNNFRVFDPKGRAISTADVSEEYDLIPLIAHILHQMTILDDLKAMHQLDRIDIENLWQLYLYLHHSPESCPQQLDLAIQRIGHGNNWKELKEVIYPRLLDQFLLATTMKDCSILLSIGHQSHDSWSEFEHEIEYKGTKYFVIASIVDLDIKPLSKLSKYYELDQEIVSHYISANGSNGKQCFQSAITRIRQKNLMCRLLYPNPVCLLTVYDPETQRRNVMTITWLTPVDNHGTFVCSINKKRFTADLLMLNSQFGKYPADIFRAKMKLILQ